DRLLDLVAKDAITVEQAEAQLRGLRQREGVLRKELDRLDVALADIPSGDTINRYVEQIGRVIVVYDDQGHNYAGGNDVMSFMVMSQEDKKRLVNAVFDGAMVDGRPAGVYVYPDDGGEGGASGNGKGPSRPRKPKKWKFTIRGRLDFELLVSDRWPSQ